MKHNEKIDAKIPNKLLGFFYHFLKPHKYAFIFSSLFILVFISLNSLFLPFILKGIINKVTVFEGDLSESFYIITKGLIAYVVFSLFGTVFISSAGLLEKKFQPDVIADINVQLTSSVHGHSYKYFSDNFGGSLANKISDLSNYFFDILGTVFWKFMPTIIILSINIFLFSLISLKLGALLAIFVFIHFSYTIYRMPVLKKKFKKHSEEISVVKGKIVDSLTNFAVVKLNSKQFFEEREIFKAHEKEKYYSRKVWSSSHRTWVPLGILSDSFGAILAVLVFYLYSKREIGLGDVSYAFMVLGTIYKSLWDFNKVILKFLSNVSKMQRALDTLLMPYEVKDKNNAKDMKVSRGDILFDKISFHYGNRRYIFKNFNLHIKPGEKVGLVGSSGAGKTTLVNLLLRLFDVQKGGVLIDGQNISEVKQKSLRDNISVVTQDSTLFHRSLKDNISYVKQNASLKEIREAAQKAGADEFISQLSKKYKTLVGERGIKLSGGQRQRVNIARTILKDAPILVLDEATSALDSETETYIQKTFKEIMKGKTTIAIAHRLSTLKLMDRIVVIEKGKIVEEGTHKQLLKNNGTYAKLWEMQSGDFIGKEDL
ncbi:MAG: ABC transporter ATP-binding protein/permease [Alphaproteobacteria bacterium]|nr:ABC transporter ATP-binding protein/permease [Alphaproteobacteria bacterium]